jgi:hypothetical protein
LRLRSTLQGGDVKVIHRLTVAATVILLCGCDLDVTDRIGAPPVPESARLFDGEGRELGPAIQLRSTWPAVVEMRLYDRAGEEITSFPGHRVALVWDPPGAVHAQPLADQPLRSHLTVLDPCLVPRRVRVGYGRVAANERYFGPWPVQISHPVRNVRIFTSGGVEITQSVRLPNARDTRLEFRLYNCAGQRITSLGEGEEIRLYWAPDNAVAVGSVADQPLQSVVFARLAAGETATVSVGIARVGEPPTQVFGPFPITVIP